MSVDSAIGLGDLVAVGTFLLALGASWAAFANRAGKMEAKHDALAEKLREDVAALRDADRDVERRANDAMGQVLEHLRRIEDRLDRMIGQSGVRS